MISCEPGPRPLPNWSATMTAGASDKIMVDPSADPNEPSGPRPVGNVGIVGDQFPTLRVYMCASALEARRGVNARHNDYLTRAR
jgi:hypothetical protein